MRGGFNVNDFSGVNSTGLFIYVMFIWVGTIPRDIASLLPVYTSFM